MKYSVEIDIDLPVERVIELFDSSENLTEWQPGLQSFEHISGTPGEPGAKSRMVYQMGNRTVEMVETILTRNLPDEFSGSYEADGVYNIVRAKFVPISENKTRYVTEQEFEMKGMMMRLMAWFAPGAFKKESMKHLENFKSFAEGRGLTD